MVLFIFFSRHVRMAWWIVYKISSERGYLYLVIAQRTMIAESGQILADSRDIFISEGRIFVYAFCWRPNFHNSLIDIHTENLQIASRTYKYAKCIYDIQGSSSPTWLYMMTKFLIWLIELRTKDSIFIFISTHVLSVQNDWSIIDMKLITTNLKVIRRR